jgi:hypothetical protein
MVQGRVPVRNIVEPGVMGEYGAAATKETKAGRAENRRVEVKVLVNEALPVHRDHSVEMDSNLLPTARFF